MDKRSDFNMSGGDVHYSHHNPNHLLMVEIETPNPTPRPYFLTSLDKGNSNARHHSRWEIPPSPSMNARRTFSIERSGLAVDKCSDEESVLLNFPMRLHKMLDDAEKQCFQDVVSWLPDGKTFKVHEVSKFADRIMGSYFNQTKFKSFQRQLNLYGFTRILNGPWRGGYVHKLFIRRERTLCEKMVRKHVPKKRNISHKMGTSNQQRDATMELKRATKDVSSPTPSRVSVSD